MSVTLFLENNFKTHLLLLILIRPIEIFVRRWLAICVDNIKNHWIGTQPPPLLSSTNIRPGSKVEEMGEIFVLHLLTPYSLSDWKSNLTKPPNYTGGSRHFPNSPLCCSRPVRLGGQEGSNMGRICTHQVTTHQISTLKLERLRSQI